MTAITVWPELQRLADAACDHFKLHMARLKPMTDLRLRCYGDCDINVASPTIRLRVHRLGRPNRPLARQTIIDTLAHELAHLKHGHGAQHRALRRAILDYWRDEWTG